MGASSSGGGLLTAVVAAEAALAGVGPTRVGAGAGAARSSGSPLIGPATTETVAARLAADRLFELTIKFVGTVGVSILRLRGQDARFSLLSLKSGTAASGPGGIGDRGWGREVAVGAAGPGGAGCSARRVVYGSLELENVTKALPLTYRVTVGRGCGGSETTGAVCCEERGSQDAERASDGEVVLACLRDLPRGRAELVLLDKAEGTLPLASRQRLRFCVLFHAFQGVFQREITVENTSSSGRKDGERPGQEAAFPRPPPLKHKVRMFVDDGAVLMSTATVVPAPDTASTAVAHRVSRPQLSSGAGVDGEETALALGHDTPAAAAATHEERLTDENGNLLPSLETLTLPFTVNVAPSVASSTSSSASATAGGGGGGSDDETGNGRSVSCFRVLPVVSMRGSADACDAAGCTYSEIDDMVEIEEDADAGSGTIKEGEEAAEGGERPWPGGESKELSSAGVHRAGHDGGASRGGPIDSEQLCQEAEEGCPDGVVFRLTNVLDRPIVVAPYSDLPLLVKLVRIEGGADDDEDSSCTGLFMFENSSVGSGGEEDEGLRRRRSISDCEAPSNDGGGGGGGKHRIISSAAALREEQNIRRGGGSLVKCGPALTIAPDATAVVRLGIRAGALTELPTATVERGEGVNFDGIVALARVGKAASSARQKGSERDWAGTGSRSSRDREETFLPERMDYSDATVCDAAGPTLVKLLRAVGRYCRPRFEVAGSTVVDLGNVGHTASKRGRRRFEVRLRSLCDTAVPVGMVDISPELEVVTEVRQGDQPPLGDAIVDKVVVPRRKAGLHGSSGSGSGSRGGNSGNGDASARADGSYVGGSGGGGGGGAGWTKRRAADGGRAGVVWVPARGEITLVFQLRLSRRRQSWAGSQAFGIRLINLADPSAEEVAIEVLARVVTQLVSIIGLDEVPPSPICLRLLSPGTPTLSGPFIQRRARSSSLEAFGSFGSPEGGSVRLAPLAIPPLRGAAGRCEGSFQLRNVSGEPVSVTIRATPAPEVAGVLSLGASLQQQDSSTGVYASAGADGRPSPSVALLPGDLLDVQAECLALPGALLPPELLPPPPSSSADASAAGGSAREGTLEWGQQLRLMGTVRVEIALEDRAGGGGDNPDSLTEGEGVLIESVALVGSLVPGPTFGLSRTSVTLSLRPPESGGGGGGGHGDGTHPYDPEGPAAFFVESFSQSLGPVRFKLAGGGRLHLARGVRVPAAEDEGGGRRRPARVVKVVTAVAEPPRGTVSANGRRAVVVRLTAADQEEEDAEEDAAGGEGNSEEKHRIRGGDGTDLGKSAAAPAAAVDGEGGDDVDAHGGQDERGLFVSILDADHPGYPAQVVYVHVDVPDTIADREDTQTAEGVLGFGVPGTMMLDGETPADVCEGRRLEGSYRLSSGGVVGGSVGRMMATNETGGKTRLFSERR